jgi:hypothetical protein
MALNANKFSCINPRLIQKKLKIENVNTLDEVLSEGMLLSISEEEIQLLTKMGLTRSQAYLYLTLLRIGKAKAANSLTTNENSPNRNLQNTRRTA